MKKSESTAPPYYPPVVEFHSSKEETLLLPAGSSPKIERETYKSIWIKNPWNESLRKETPLRLQVTSFSRPSSKPVKQEGKQIAVVWSDGSDLDFSGTALNLSLVSLDDKSDGKTIPLGNATAINSFASASAPVWAAGRWWVAWVKAVKASAATAHMPWQTMLSSYDVATKKLECKPLKGLSNWNTDISIATTDGWLCAVWHASKDGDYPGEAVIVTAFEQLPKSNP